MRPLPITVQLVMKQLSKTLIHIALVAGVLCGSDAQAQVANLTVTGRITNVPCLLAVDSVDFGDVLAIDIINNGASMYKNFNITLNGCDMQTLRTATLKFNGTAVSGTSDVLALTEGEDSAQGVGVQIERNDTTHSPSGGVVRVDGSETYSFNLASNRNIYTFRTRYIQAGPNNVFPGVANATATVTLTYS